MITVADLFVQDAVGPQEQMIDTVAELAPASEQLCIHHFLRSHAQRIPDAIAIAAPGRKPLTYSRLLIEIDKAVKILNAAGIGRNDRVAVVLPNGPEMAVAFLTIAAAATCAPLNPAYTANEFNFYLSDLNAKALIVQSGIDSPAIAVAQKRGIPVIQLSPVPDAEAGVFTVTSEERLRPEYGGFAQPTDIALTLHTSGTTSRPKLVPLTQANVCASAYNTVAALELSSSDRCLNVMPLFHIHGLVGAVLSSMMAGSSVVCTPGFDPENFFAWLETFRPTWYTAVPTMHQAVLSCTRANSKVPAGCSLRFIRSCSAALPPRTMQELERVFRVPVIEAYGMTEAAHQIAINPLPPRARKAGSVGLPAGAEVAVMDEQGNLVPSGEIGEVVIRGVSVMSGYANAPEANEESFNHGWFRTGDQGYLDADGYLFLTGRLKEIINRGGEKISPREVDEILLEHSAISEAVTFPVQHATLGEEVAAAVVLRDGAAATEEEIQMFAGMRLAEFKVPRHVMIIQQIPKSATGKVQRMQLAEKLGLATLNQAPGRTKLGHIAVPKGIVEKKLATIWAQVLGVVLVGLHDNFFELGGNSLLAVQLIGYIERTFGKHLSPTLLFQAPTIERLAKILREEKWPESWSIRRISRPLRCPASLSQERLWFIEQLSPSAAYNSGHTIRLIGTLNLAALEQSLNEIVRRHEALRTIFAAVDGQPFQIVTPPSNSSLLTIDLRGITGAAEREAEAERIVIEEAERLFDLAKGPLFRAKLVRVSGEDHVLALVMHHVVTDGWSWEVFFRELETLYEAFCKGKPLPLTDIPIQYIDFAVWQRQLLQGGILGAQLSYWKEQLSSAPVLELPTDRPRSVVQISRGDRQSLVLPKNLSDGIKALSHKEGATLFMTLLAAFQTLLYRYTGQSDVVVGSPTAGRTPSQVEGLIGFFVNTLVLRTDLSGNPTFKELLARVRKVALGAYEHQDLPFEKLVEELNPRRSLTRTPLFQVMFAFQNVPTQAPALSGLTVRRIEINNKIAKFDLSLYIWEETNGLRVSVEYKTDLFDAATIGRMLGHFQILLEGIGENPEQRIADLPILTEAERYQLLVEWNDTKRDYPSNKCIHELFEAQVEKTPEAVAVIFEGQQLTYQGLNQRANQLAYHLRALGVGPEVLVGLCVERSLEMVIGLLGILKAAGAYVPLDATYPEERLNVMMEDAQVKLVLTQQKLLRRLPKNGSQAICLDSDWRAIAQRTQENPFWEVSPDSTAYAIYTSGSTGKPKGVQILHRGVVNFLNSMREQPAITEQDLLLAVTTISFDIAGLELYLPLTVGARVVLASRKIASDGARLSELINRSEPTVMQATPATCRMLMDAGWQGSEKLKILCGGEALRRDLADRLLERAHSVWNLYGPTETTIWSTVHRVEAGNGSISIGRPIANTQIYVLDSHYQPVPIGLPGELYIGGAGLARGYLNQPALTAEKFIPDPFSDNLDDRLYRTGDLARCLPDGNIEYLGRVDHQVKIRGFRVELGEIEVALGHHPALREVLVVAREETPGDTRLVAYVVSAQASAPTYQELRHFLRDKLPSYMIPASLVVLDAFPLTSSGKVDRQALPTSDTRAALEGTFVAAQNPLELQLTRIWEKLLGTQPIGTKDNFFDLGGHSLLAVRLVAQIEKAFSKDLPLATFFQAPTVEQLAKLLNREEPTAPWSSLIPLQPKGSKPPFFWVYGDHSNAVLHRYIDPDQPLYGFMHQSEDGKPALFTRIEDIAGYYLKEIHTVQSVGPYFLGGYSFGGTVAYEMAQQLKRQGEEVALLFLLDSRFPSDELPDSDDVLRSGNLHDEAHRHFRNLALLGRREKFTYARVRVTGIMKGKIDGMRAKISKILGKMICNGYLAMGHPIPISLRRSYILDIYSQARQNYVPQPYPGRATYVKSEKHSNAHLLEWNKLFVEGMDLYELPGDHLDMTQEPNVGVWAEHLKSCLRNSHTAKAAARDTEMHKRFNVTRDL